MMTRQLRSTAVTALVLTSIALVASGCGRKTALDRPGVTPPPAASDSTTITGGFSGPETPDTEPAKPDRPFILDPLID